MQVGHDGQRENEGDCSVRGWTRRGGILAAGAGTPPPDDPTLGLLPAVQGG